MQTLWDLKLDGEVHLRTLSPKQLLTYIGKLFKEEVMWELWIRPKGSFVDFLTGG